MIGNALTAAYYLPFTQEMADALVARYGERVGEDGKVKAATGWYKENGAIIQSLVGGMFHDMDDKGKMAYIRGYIEYFHGDRVRTFNAKYGVMGGYGAKFNMTSDYNVMNAVSAFFDGRTENLRRVVGSKMKVSAFWMNLGAPASVLGHSTMDTMEVGISTGIPHANAFGPEAITKIENRGVVSSNVVFYEAHRRMASRLAERYGLKLMPCQIQSILWGKGQAINAAFPTNTRAGKAGIAEIKEIWRKAGLADTDEARSEAIKKVFNILAPSLDLQAEPVTVVPHNALFYLREEPASSSDKSVRAEYERLKGVMERQVQASYGLEEYQRRMDVVKDRAYDAMEAMRPHLKYQDAVLNTVQDVITGEPMVMEEAPVAIDVSDLPASKKAILDYAAKNNVRGAYTVKDNGKQVEVTRNSLKEIMWRQTSPRMDKDLASAKLKSALMVPQIIEGMKYVGTYPNEDTKVDTDAFDYYLSLVRIDGSDWVVRSVVAELRSGGRYYDHTLTKKRRHTWARSD